MSMRVVISGCGVVTAAGSELEPFWTSLMAGECHIEPLQDFTLPELGQLDGAVVVLPAADSLPESLDSDRRRARCLELALAAADRAIADACLSLREDERTRTGVVFATTMGEERQVGDLSERRQGSGDDSIDSGFLARSNNHRAAAEIARRYGLEGPVLLASVACGSGNAALAFAYDLIASGAVDRMIVGGADTLTRLIYCGFRRMGALSSSICRPFDKERDGVSFGEGAGALVLESLDSALQRGARIRSELVGYGISNDAYHVTAPAPHGTGFIQAIEQTLSSTGLCREDIGYVSTHGTGTAYNDRGEGEALLHAFGAHAKELPVSSIKSMIGHTNGAAGIIEAVVCTLALQRQEVPPTARLRNPDPEMPLHHVLETGRHQQMEACLSLAAGFGGLNVSLAFKAFHA